MLNPFPELLDFTFFVPMLFRITVAGAFVYLLLWHFKHRSGVKQDIEKIARPLGGAGVYAILLAEIVVAVGIFLGAWTQIFAILAALGFLKMAFFNKKLPYYAPLSRAAYLFLAVMCVSLLITGAGAFAFDIPL